MRVTVVVCYYRAPIMLRKQLDNWASYSAKAREHFTLIVIDDGSPEPAADVIKPSDGVQLYRVAVDKPWNRNGARNLGAHVCKTEWLLNLDIDHLLPPSSADALLGTKIDPHHWYRFPRWRVGRADETRRKDAIPESCEFGKIRPHIDSHLMTRDLFMRSPYDEDYSGFLGGGSPFLARMEATAPVKVLPDDVCLHVHTRHSVPDASVSTLSRDTSEYSRLRKLKERTGNTKPNNLLRFEWSRVL
jgi:glycosyltransferase involved in cell wall biosynthesis